LWIPAALAAGITGSLIGAHAADELHTPPCAWP
jgi:hypothetical protein